MAADDRTLGVSAAAKWLGINARTLHKHVDSGDLVADTSTGSARFTVASLEAFVESQRVRPGTIRLPKQYRRPST